MLAWVYVPCVPENSWVIGFLTLIVLIASLRLGSESRLSHYQFSGEPKSSCIDGDEPFLRRDDLDDARLHTVFVDFANEMLETSKLIHGLHKVRLGVQRTYICAVLGIIFQATSGLGIFAYRLEDRNPSSIIVVIWLNLFIVHVLLVLRIRLQV